MKQPPYSLADLVELFGVPERTVRSWIQKGLLPRPRGRGPASFYDQEHADRLGFIVRLREAASRSGSAGTSWRDTMLPLETIREILDGLDPEMVHRVATGEEPLAVADLMSTSAPMMLADAAAPSARSMPRGRAASRAIHHHPARGQPRASTANRTRTRRLARDCSKSPRVDPGGRPDALVTHAAMTARDRAEGL